MIFYTTNMTVIFVSGFSKPQTREETLNSLLTQRLKHRTHRQKPSKDKQIRPDYMGMGAADVSAVHFQTQKPLWLLD